MKNPQAFPRPVAEIEDRRSEEQEGMTLLDYFAGQALVGYLSSPGASVDNSHPANNPARAAAWSYKQAEVMVKERQKYLDKE